MLNRFILLTCASTVLASCTASTIDIRLEPRAEATAGASSSSSVSEVSEIQTITIPSSVDLDVPFTPQAPYANWEDPYQEACEEASVIMVDYFYRKNRISQDVANLEIIQLTNWETTKGYGEDVTVDELAIIVRDYYGYNARVSDDVSKESIMHELSQGHPVVVPAAGRQLGNPYFSGAGPWYHMLVIRGYDKKYFITNDPGTRRGEGYSYRHDVLIDAIHDWTGVAEETEKGAKKMLIITPK